MQIEVKNMSPKEIRLAGLDALQQSLGIVGMIRFLQYFDKGYGDYSKDRHKWLGNPDFDQILDEIEKMQK